MSHPGFIEPKIYFLTAYKTSEFDRLTLDLNVSGIFEKPMDIEQLKTILEEWPSFISLIYLGNNLLSYYLGL